MPKQPEHDHHKLGQQLDLFLQSELVGTGLPLFTPRGTVMINQMMQLMRDISQEGGYHEVRTGHMTRDELYAKSGHLDKFKDNLFQISTGKGEDGMALKPMNCPHHMLLFASKLYSYRDLPVRYSEFTTLHRNEVSGALGGLTRVRALTQDDAHAFLRLDQVEAEVAAILKQIEKVMKIYSLSYRVVLSVRDPKEKYLGEAKVWDKAEQTLEDLCRKHKLDFERAEGEAAFYGPKLDFMATDALGREWQLSTIQLDFVQPARLGLHYVDEQGAKQAPAVIHRAVNGTFERMLGILIEHYGGDFPLWLAPEQVRIMTVNDEKKVVKYAGELSSKLREAGLRVNMDNSNESVGRKIREAELMKVPYVIVIGEKEVKTGKITPRLRQGQGEELSAQSLISHLLSQIQERT